MVKICSYLANEHITLVLLHELNGFLAVNIEVLQVGLVSVSITFLFYFPAYTTRNIMINRGIVEPSASPNDPSFRGELNSDTQLCSKGG